MKLDLFKVSVKFETIISYIAAFSWILGFAIPLYFIGRFIFKLLGY